MSANTQEGPRPAVGKRKAKEARTLFRASISSGIATAADGLTYQMLLLAFTGSYGLAAFVGAVLGGVTNFGINRRWVFSSCKKQLRAQAIEYAFTCLATYAALQTCLFVFVEGLHVDMHAAWIPAKAIAWLFVSYPIQRFFVFSGGNQPVVDLEPADPVSERPSMAA